MCIGHLVVSEPGLRDYLERELERHRQGITCLCHARGAPLDPEQRDHLLEQLRERLERKQRSPCWRDHL